MISNTLVLLVVGGVLLMAGADLLMLGVSRPASAAGISPLVGGLTVVAFGTSSPEMAVTVGSLTSLLGGALVLLGTKRPPGADQQVPAATGESS